WGGASSCATAAAWSTGWVEGVPPSRSPSRVLATKMRDEWTSALGTWAANNQFVRELWLFGSRAKGNCRPDNDIDIALVLMPGESAMFAYFDAFEEWKEELKAAVDWEVDLRAIGHDRRLDSVVRSTGVRLWTRSTNDRGKRPEWPGDTRGLVRS